MNRTCKLTQSTEFDWIESTVGPFVSILLAQPASEFFRKFSSVESYANGSQRQEVFPSPRQCSMESLMFARKNQYSHKSPRIPAPNSPRFALAVVGIAIAFAGCLGCSGDSSYGSSGLFTREPLDGEELAVLLDLNCAKYVYRGPKSYYYWRLSTQLYGPDDQLIETTFLGGGGCELQSGSRFFFNIPVVEGGLAVTAFGGMKSKQDIAPLLPKRERSLSWILNPSLRQVKDKPILVGLFSLDAQSIVRVPNYEIPKGHGGHVLAVVLDIKATAETEENPFDKRTGKR